MKSENEPSSRCAHRSARAITVAFGAAMLCVATGALAWDQAELPVYRYVNAKGRAVYVNGLDRVPQRYRGAAKALDLSNISLNEKLGNEIKADVERRASRLLATKECQRRREATEGGLSSIAWRDHGHLVVLGGAALLLLLITPWVSKRLPTGAWGRILTYALPVLVFMALWSTSAVQASRTLEKLKSRAKPCLPETYSLALRESEKARRRAIEDGAKRPSLRDQWWMLEALEKEVRATNQRREGEWLGRPKE